LPNKVQEQQLKKTIPKPIKAVQKSVTQQITVEKVTMDKAQTGKVEKPKDSDNPAGLLSPPKMTQQNTQSESKLSQFSP
jgi:hypothetical protein